MRADNVDANSWLQRGSNLRFLGIAAAVYTLVALLLYAPALGSSRFVFGTDTYSHDYIFHLYGWNSIRQTGQIPLWCPYLFCGLPTVASFAFCPFYPSQLLFFVLPFNTAFTMQYVMALTIAGFWICVWMRALGLGRTAALWAGLAIMVSGHLLTLTHAGHMTKMFAIAWSPLALVGAHWALKRIHPARAAAAMAVAFAMQALASHSQILYATSLTCFVYILIGVATSPELRDAVVLISAGRPGFWDLLKPGALSFAAFAAAVILAVGLSSSQLFPGVEMSGVSNRAAGVAWSEAVETSYPVRETLEYAIPRVFGDSVRETPTPYFGAWGERIVSDFIGLPILLLAFFGVMLNRGKLRWFLLASAVVSLLIGFGKNTPIYAILFSIVPGFSSFRSPGTYMFITTLAVVALAALGMHAIPEYLESRGASMDTPPERASGSLMHRLMHHPRRDLFLALAVAVFALIMLIVGLGHNYQVNLAIATAEEKNRHHLYRDLWVLGAEMLITSLLLALALIIGRKGLTLLAAAALAMPAIHNRHFLRFDPLDRYRTYLESQPLYAALKQVQSRPLRVLEERALKVDNILHGVGTPTGYHPVVFGRYEWLVDTLGFGSETFTDMMAINHAHTYSTRPPEDATWAAASRFGNPEQVLWKRQPVASYVKPRVTIVEKGSEKDIAAAMRLAEFQPSQVALISHSARVAARIPDELVPVSADLAEWQPSKINLLVSSDGPGLLPIAEVYAPGWKAENGDGVRLKTVPVNLAQRCLFWEGGSGTVRLTYDPFSFRLGVFLSLLTAAFMVVLPVARFSHQYMNGAK